MTLEGGAFPGMRVLIVEDSAVEAETFADLVAHHGHDPLLAESAEAALQNLGILYPDAVLLDICLPGMSGVEFLRTLSERQQPLPVVVISGLASEDQARDCLKLGAVDFLPKPLTLEQLQVVLDCLEMQLPKRPSAQDVLKASRRRFPRVDASLEVMVGEPGAGQARGESVNLSPFGIKVRSAARVHPGAALRLSFSPPDGGPPISVLSLMVREDPDGYGFTFVNLTNPDFHRLRRFVNSRIPSPV